MQSSLRFMTWLVACLVSMVGIAGCGPAQARIEVAVLTDAVPGQDFAHVEIVLSRPPEARPLIRSALADATIGEDFSEEHLIARFEAVALRQWVVSGRLLRRDGSTLLERTLDVDVSEDTRVVLRFDRGCIGVRCPTASACLGGRCVPSDCAGQPEGCPSASECTTDRDCPVATCAAGRCIQGICFAFSQTDSCGTDERCDPEAGCVPAIDTCGEPCALDECRVGRILCEADGTMRCEPFLVRPPGTPCGAGVCDSGGTCAPCVEDAPCDTGNACEEGRISCRGGSSSCVAVGPRASGSVCRPAAGPCDVAETCDGTGVACPSDTLTSAGTTCREARGDCDRAEVCDGVSAACPADAQHDASYVCRTARGPCDLPELCGGGDDCPADMLAPTSVTCRPSAGACDVAEQCSGTAAGCPEDARRASTFVCRPASGACDVSERCDGTSAVCGMDAFAMTGTMCPAGFCNGLGACASGCTPMAPCSTGNPCQLGRTDCSTGTPVCVAAGPAPAGTMCRAAAGVCDVAEQCNGTSSTCPADRFATATTSCRPATGGCDVAEACTGTSATCPTDRFATATTTCRPAVAGGCDVAEQCTGTTSTCPADRFAPSTTSCRTAAGPCDVAEQCTGTTATCPADAIAPTTRVCRVASGACDVAEQCTGTSVGCPVDRVAARSVVCRPVAGECDLAEQCTGTTAACPADVGRPAGTSCSIGSCDTAAICALNPDCTTRFRVVDATASSPSLHASASTIALAGVPAGMPASAGFFRDTDGSLITRVEGPGAYASGATSNYVAYVTSASATDGAFATYDLATGTFRGQVGIKMTGTLRPYPRADGNGGVFAASLSGSPWQFSMGGLGNQMGSGATTWLVEHDSMGRYVRHVVMSSAHFVPLVASLGDGRWAVVVAGHTAPVTLGSHTTPVGTRELVILTSTLTFQSASALTFTPVAIGIVPTSNHRVLVGSQTEAWSDAGLVWRRMDCAPTVVDAASGAVYVATATATGSFCGRAIPTGQSGTAWATLNPATGATSAASFTPTTSVQAVEISSDGDAYAFLAAGGSVCGTANPSSTLVGF